MPSYSLPGGRPLFEIYLLRLPVSSCWNLTLGFFSFQKGIPIVLLLRGVLGSRWGHSLRLWDLSEGGSFSPESCGIWL